MSSSQLTFRDRIKFACLLRCVDAGLDENEMIARLRQATYRIKNEGTKTASLGWIRPAASTLGWLAMLGVPAVGLSAAALGNIAGQTAKNIEVGRLPTTEEIKELDLIATYRRTAEEIERRTKENEEEHKNRSKPSVRRMF